MGKGNDVVVRIILVIGLRMFFDRGKGTAETPFRESDLYIYIYMHTYIYGYIHTYLREGAFLESPQRGFIQGALDPSLYGTLRSQDLSEHVSLKSF